MPSFFSWKLSVFVNAFFPLKYCQYPSKKATEEEKNATDLQKKAVEVKKKKTNLITEAVNIVDDNDDDDKVMLDREDLTKEAV